MMPMQNLSHPAEVLKGEYLEPLGMSALALAKHLNVPRKRIHLLVMGESLLTVDTEMRHSKLFGNTPELWINMQRTRDLARAPDTVGLSDITPLEAV